MQNKSENILKIQKDKNMQQKLMKLRILQIEYFHLELQKKEETHKERKTNPLTLTYE